MNLSYVLYTPKSFAVIILILKILSKPYSQCKSNSQIMRAYKQ